MSDRIEVLLVRAAGEGPTAEELATHDEEFRVTEVDDPQRGDLTGVDCVVCSLSTREGLAMLEWVQAPVVVYAHDGDESLAARAVNRGADRYVPDDCSLVELASAVREAALKGRERRRWYTKAIDGVDRPHAALDDDLVYRFANDAYREHYGLDGTVVGRHVEEVLGSLAFDRLEPSLGRALEGERASVAPAELPTEEPLEVQCRPLREEGSVVGVGMTVADASEREWARRRFRTFFEVMPAAGFVLDEEGTTTAVNDTFCERTGYDREEIVGNRLDELPGILPKEDRQRTIERFERLRRGERPPPMLAEYHTKSGQQRYTYVESVPLMRDGELERVIGIARDVTELKRRQRELARKNERLEEFASIVGHDLRNPLEVVKGELELARERGSVERLDRAVDATDRMEAILEDLLTLAREGTGVGETSRVDLATVAEECWAYVDTGEATLEADGTATLSADPGRLRELLENLYRNAIEHGGRAPTVRIGPLPEGFYVEDDGPGIPEDERETVFEPGYTTAADGTGFGLNIVDQIATAHDWEVGVTESHEGGARFEVTGVDSTASADASSTPSA